MSIEHLIGKEENAQIVVTISGAESDTPNLYVWDKTVPDRPELIAKIWLYPDGRINYRSFVPKTTREITLREPHKEVYDSKDNL